MVIVFVQILVKRSIDFPLAVKMKTSFITYEPPHYKTNKMVCASSEDSDQPGHPPSLIRVFACAQWVAKDPSFLHAQSKDSDQTRRMPRLIRVFAGRTYHFCWFCLEAAHILNYRAWIALG